MALPVVKQCCCGCTLETGSKIIAWLEIIGGVLMVIAGILAALGGGGESHEDFIGAGVESPVSQILGGILSTIFGIVLLRGIKKRRPDHIGAWVIITLVGIIVYIVAIMILVVFLIVAGAIKAAVAVVVVCAIQIGVSFYYLVVVSSFRKEIVAAGNIKV